MCRLCNYPFSNRNLLHKLYETVIKIVENECNYYYYSLSITKFYPELRHLRFISDEMEPPVTKRGIFYEFAILKRSMGHVTNLILPPFEELFVQYVIVLCLQWIPGESAQIFFFFALCVFILINGKVWQLLRAYSESPKHERYIKGRN